MKFFQFAAIAGVAAVLATANALAASAAPSCTGFGKFGAQRTVDGVVLERQSDSLGFTHIVVKDDQTGCRVFILAANQTACAAGKRFAGFGRLRSDFKGADYDATLDHDRSGGKCL